MASLLYCASDDGVDKLIRAIGDECGVECVAAKGLAGFEERAASGTEFDFAVVSIETVKDLPIAEAAVKGRFRHDRVCMVCPDDPRVSIEAVQASSFGHLIIGRLSNPVKNGHHFARVLGATQGLGGLFPKMEIHEIGFESSAQKSLAASAVTQHLAEAGCPERVANVVANAAHELIMNAMYNAPVDESGNRPYAGESRGSDLKFAPGEIVMEFGVDDGKVAINVIDKAGSLRRSEITRHLASGLNPEKLQLRPDTSRAGAGIGLSMIVKSGGSLRFSCVPNQRTDACVIYELANSLMDFRKQSQFLSTTVAE